MIGVLKFTSVQHLRKDGNHVCSRKENSREKNRKENH